MKPHPTLSPAYWVGLALFIVAGFMPDPWWIIGDVTGIALCVVSYAVYYKASNAWRVESKAYLEARLAAVRWPDHG